MSYYIRVLDVLYYLDSTSSISVSYPGSLSENPMSNNAVSSDNYIVRQPVASISGKITDIKSSKSYDSKLSNQYIDGLLSARDNKIPLSLKYRLDKEEDFGWYIENFTHTQTPTNGFGMRNSEGIIIQSFQVEIQLKKPLFTGQIRAITSPPQAFIDAFQTKTKSGKSTVGVEPFSDEAQRRERINALEEERQYYGEQIKETLFGKENDNDA